MAFIEDQVIFQYFVDGKSPTLVLQEGEGSRNSVCMFYSALCLVMWAGQMPSEQDNYKWTYVQACA